MSFKLGGFIKQMFTKGNKAESAAAPVVVAPPPPAPLAPPAPPRPAFVPAAARTAPTFQQPGKKLLGPGVEIPLQSILAVLPLELKPMVRQEEVPGMNFSVPVVSVLPQLASGSIKVTFGDLRAAAPTVFTDDTESDGVIVSLPLHEVLSRLNPALLTRRPTQKQIIVPEEISSPFSGRGENLNLGVGNNSPQTPGAPAAPQVAAPAPVTPVQRASNGNVSPLTTPLPGGTDMFQRKAAPNGNGNGKAPIFPRKPGAPASNGTEFLRRQNTPAAPTPPPADLAPAAPIAFKPSAPLPTGPVTPISPIAPSEPVDEQPLFQRATTPTPPVAPISPIAAVPVTPPATGVPPRPKEVVPATPRVVQPAPAAAPANPGDADALLVPVSALAEAWPDAVRTEMVQQKLVDARLALPVKIVEAALKRGRVTFPWKTIRSWMRPAPASAASPDDAKELEFPLAVLAPLFVARRKADGHVPRVTVSDAIPNLFFGLPKPEPAKEAQPADTNYFSKDDSGTDTAQQRKAAAPPADGGTDLLLKCATPNEIVSRAAALDGVAGALIALPDGLMVANRIPPEFNGDTLAAFLPHIFAKVSQCTKELRMGDLNNLNFTVGNVPWKIFRVNAIFFAAFGRVGEGLPTAELVALAGELDRKRS